ncbi:Mimitin, mitochondrial [Microtus ochrogaster]|uniref:Mimitin, mitochondrial n=1 Tax=Microtus ochrogaster TaxID=79684 RepID=A0A8J6KWP5_MICOH|nr:Mimitin, mitochondrial [Microtus ochrogaster]
MGWWRAVLRSLWSSLSKEVREHVGTDHLGNKYYYIAQYKNWRGESEERLRVGAPPRPVSVAAIRGRASSVPAPSPGVRGLGRCLG